MTRLDPTKINLAVKAARMYYYHEIKTADIANAMNVSRSTISRLLDFARDQGLVNIKVIDPMEESAHIETIIKEQLKIKNVHVVNVSNVLNETEWLERTAEFAAKYLNTKFSSNMILGIAWGTTMSAISRHLLRKITSNSKIVQLNGAGNTQTMGIRYASEIIMRFEQNYDARAVLFPVPTFFDYPETKVALWREKCIRTILDIQQNADLLIHSIGAVNAGIPSMVHSGGYLGKKEYKELKEQQIVGDIATVFFRKDGSFLDIPLNKRTSGPDLTLFKEKESICVISGLAKVEGTYSAIKAGLVNNLIIDEPSARELITRYID